MYCADGSLNSPQAQKNNIWARACGGLVRAFPQFHLFYSFLTVFPILLQVRNNPLKTTLQVILSKKTQTSLGNLPVLFLINRIFRTISIKSFLGNWNTVF